MLLDPSEMRQDYDKDQLLEEMVDADPIRQFASWFEDARNGELMEPNAMSLSTATADGGVSSRMVLMKGFDERGFTFFTSYDSRKGQELAENSRAALLFWWDRLHRQVRIEGTVTRVDPAESDAYFATRPHGSRIGASTSPQSRVIEHREWLEARFAEAAEAFPDDVPRPASWGGYRVTPDAIEFWQGRRSRLHDRLLYSRNADGWKIERLAP
ncbi:MAG: pyridoxamine 5'-phosphate oxidase [Geminicoccaceae bacterium]